MVSITRSVVIFLILSLVEANFTRIYRENVLLSRKRRYLNFPMGSNFVITLSHIKLFLQVQPRGWAILLEADVPFALPADTRQLKKRKKIKRHAVDRDNYLQQLQNAFTGIGLDGEICIRKMICTILQYKETKRKSLIRDLLYAAFIYPEENSDLHRESCNTSLERCSVPLLEYIFESVLLA